MKTTYVPIAVDIFPLLVIAPKEKLIVILKTNAHFRNSYLLRWTLD